MSGDGTRICSFQCDPNCQTCEGNYNCSLCSSNYYLSREGNSTICREQKRVSGELLAINNPKVFILIFNDTWPEYFSNFSATATLNSLQKESYSCSFAPDFSKIQAYSITCQYSSNITAGTFLTVKLLNLPTVNRSSPAKMISQEFSLQLTELVICPDASLAWDSGKPSLKFFFC